MKMKDEGFFYAWLIWRICVKDRRRQVQITGPKPQVIVPATKITFGTFFVRRLKRLPHKVVVIRGYIDRQGKLREQTMDLIGSIEVRAQLVLEPPRQNAFRI